MKSKCISSAEMTKLESPDADFPRISETELLSFRQSDH